jgi:hypothetical protein
MHCLHRRWFEMPIRVAGGNARCLNTSTIDYREFHVSQSRTQLRSICEYRERSNPRLLHARVSHRRQKWDPHTWPKRLDVYRTGHGEQWGYCGSYTKFSLALLKR